MINVPASRIKDLSCASFPEQDSWENKTGNSHDLRLLTTPLGYKALYFPTCQVTFTFLFNLGPGHFCSWLIAVRDGPSFFWGSGREEGNFLGHDFFFSPSTLYRLYMSFFDGHKFVRDLFLHQKQNLESRKHVLDFSWLSLHDLCFRRFCGTFRNSFSEIVEQPTPRPAPSTQKQIRPLTRILRRNEKNGHIQASEISVESRAHCFECSLHV